LDKSGPRRGCVALFFPIGFFVTVRLVKRRRFPLPGNGDYSSIIAALAGAERSSALQRPTPFCLEKPQGRTTGSALPAHRTHANKRHVCATRRGVSRPQGGEF